MKDPQAFIDSFSFSHFTEAAEAFTTIADKASEHSETLNSKVKPDMDSSEWTGAAAKRARKMFEKLHSSMDNAEGEAEGMSKLLTDIGERLGDAQSKAKKQIEALEGEELAYHVQGSMGGDCTVIVSGTSVHYSSDRLDPGDHGRQQDIKAWEAKYGKNYATTCQDYEEAIADALIDAIEADEELALVLRESFISDNARKPAFNGEPLINLDPEVIDDGLPPKDAGPQEVKDWWDGLSADEQQYFIELEPGRIGDRDGVPVDARDEANRLYVDQRGEDVDTEIEDLEKEIAERRETLGGNPNRYDPELAKLTRELEDLRDEQAFLDKVDGVVNKDADNGQQHYLIDVDAKVDQAVISTGNPDTADNTAVYVPGTEASNTIGGQVGRTDTIQAAAANADPNSETAAVMWLGYDTPELHQPMQSEFARQGAPKLNSFMDTMRTTHQGSPSNTTVIGHSYGSTVVGTADARGDGLGADNIVVAGSPGLGYNDDTDGEVTNADELATDSSNVYIAASPKDPITYPDAHGPSPAYDDFGGTHVEAGVAGHSDYWNKGSTSLENQAFIVTGRRDQVMTAQGRGEFSSPLGDSPLWGN